MAILFIPLAVMGVTLNIPSRERDFEVKLHFVGKMTHLLKCDQVFEICI